MEAKNSARFSSTLSEQKALCDKNERAERAHPHEPALQPMKTALKNVQHERK